MRAVAVAIVLIIGYSSPVFAEDMLVPATMFDQEAFDLAVDRVSSAADALDTPEEPDSAEVRAEPSSVSSPSSEPGASESARKSDEAVKSEGPNPKNESELPGKAQLGAGSESSIPLDLPSVSAGH